MKRTILIPLFYRGHYGRLRPLLKALAADPRFTLKVITAAPAAKGYFFRTLKHSEPRALYPAIRSYLRARLSGILERFGGARYEPDYVTRKMRQDGFPVHAQIPFFLDGGVPATMAKSIGIGFIPLVEELQRLKPDFVFVNADRFEMMAVAIAAAYLNIPIVHHEAGDVSGTIDESVRHAITKFAHVHLCASESARRRVVQMGERPEYAFVVGSPAIDVLAGLDLSPAGKRIEGVDLTQPYLLALVHAVTTERPEENLRMMEVVLETIRTMNLPTLLVGSNLDAGSHKIGVTFYAWRAAAGDTIPVVYAKSLHPDVFYLALANASCAVGNSSSFLREGAYLGTPAVLIGSRQTNRERGANSAEVPPERDAIIAAVRAQLRHGRYPRDLRFGDGRAAAKIVEVLATVNPPIQKQFKDIAFHA